jgi:hypothetical protein
MRISRRNWLLGCGGVLTGRLVSAQAARDSEAEVRIRNIIDQYSDQGFHRTATTVDRQSGEWLLERVGSLGLKPLREAFPVNRVVPGVCRLVVEGRPIGGLPLFDGAFTEPAGIRGRLGPIGSDADIGVVTAPPNTAAGGPLGDARRQPRHKAIVFITRGGRPGLCPSNADFFLKPFGPPVLQVSSEHAAVLDDHAARRSEVHLVAAATRAAATSFNITATIPGPAASALPPLVIMTPRSGWYTCASERGGGIACWLELMRVFRTNRPQRTIEFVASGGHELGHLGIDVFVANRRGLVSGAAGWMHLGANIGAAVRPAAAGASRADDGTVRHAVAAMGSGNTIQASDDLREEILSTALTAHGLGISRRVPRGTVPGGEAEVVHRGGGKYVSVIGSNALFHNLEDAGSGTVELPTIVRFVEAFTSVANTLMNGSTP